MGKSKTKKTISDSGAVKRQLGEFTVKEFSIRGIIVRVLESSKIKIASKEVIQLIKNIEEGNKWIKDPAFQVKSCFISLTPHNQFVKYLGKPVLLLDHEQFLSGTAIHEIGHAIFDYYQNSKSAPANAALKIAYFFLQLSKTTKAKATLRKRDGNVEVEFPAGLLIADPSQWSKTLFSEHPFENLDEFFASVREAMLVDRSGLDRAVTKLSKTDPSIKGLSSSLLKLVSVLEKNENPKPPPSDKLLNDAVTILKKLDSPLILETNHTLP